MHSYVCPNNRKKRKEKECVYAQLGRCIRSMSKGKKKRKECVCMPELGSICIAKEVTNVDSKYVVCVMRYPTMNK